jgi:molecular chaperone DnaK (HSP70)
MGIPIGIDLGTTNSAVARRNAYGRPEVLPNREGTHLTPSAIYFGTDPPLIGAEAMEWGRVGNDLIASFFKPQMGNPLYRLEFHGRSYDAGDLSALILERLKQDAEAATGETVRDAVITVPAYFADPQRKATIEAGRRAGLNVIRILNEPTAAALAYGLQHSGDGETVLIYDLGGGTFDVTVARITPGEVEVLSTAGDHDLGGKNWDDRIATFLAEKFQAETGIDPLDDPVQLNEVLSIAERAKWSLSERANARITLQLGAERRSYDLDRSAFEAMTFPLMDRTRRLTEEALAEARLGWGALGSVLLVGGSTRMPMVRQYVTQMAGKPPRSGVNVDEAVALGAAIQAAMDAGASTSDATPKFTLTGARRVRDVMSHSLGVVAVSPDGSRYVNDIVIRRNLPIPAENAKQYLHATHGGRNDRLEVYLTQGESDRPADCSILGRYVFGGIRATDVEVTIDVALSYDANGVVQVRAVQRDTHQTLPMTVEPVPDDLSWLDGPPRMAEIEGPPELVTVYLLIDVSASMTGEPLVRAQKAAREFLDRCDFTRFEVGLVSFSQMVTLQTRATDNPRKVLAGLNRLEPESTTNLSDAITLAMEQMLGTDRTRYMVILTDGYPDAPEDAVERAGVAKAEGIQIVAIGTGDADLDYLKRLASTDSGTIFARGGELVQAFGHIARMISEGGRSLRMLS